MFQSKILVEKIQLLIYIDSGVIKVTFTIFVGVKVDMREVDTIDIKI